MEALEAGARVTAEELEGLLARGTTEAVEKELIEAGAGAFRPGFNDVDLRLSNATFGDLDFLESQPLLQISGEAPTIGGPLSGQTPEMGKLYGGMKESQIWDGVNYRGLRGDTIHELLPPDITPIKPIKGNKFTIGVKNDVVYFQPRAGNNYKLKLNTTAQKEFFLPKEENNWLYSIDEFKVAHYKPPGIARPKEVPVVGKPKTGWAEIDDPDSMLRAQIQQSLSTEEAELANLGRNRGESVIISPAGAGRLEAPIELSEASSTVSTNDIRLLNAQVGKLEDGHQMIELQALGNSKKLAERGIAADQLARLEVKTGELGRVIEQGGGMNVPANVEELHVRVTSRKSLAPFEVQAPAPKPLVVGRPGLAGPPLPHPGADLGDVKQGVQLVDIRLDDLGGGGLRQRFNFDMRLDGSPVDQALQRRGEYVRVNSPESYRSSADTWNSMSPDERVGLLTRRRVSPRTRNWLIGGTAVSSLSSAALIIVGAVLLSDQPKVALFRVHDWFNQNDEVFEITKVEGNDTFSYTLNKFNKYGESEGIVHLEESVLQSYTWGKPEGYPFTKDPDPVIPPAKFKIGDVVVKKSDATGPDTGGSGEISQAEYEGRWKYVVHFPVGAGWYFENEIESSVPSVPVEKPILPDDGDDWGFYWDDINKLGNYSSTLLKLYVRDEMTGFVSYFNLEDKEVTLYTPDFNEMYGKGGRHLGEADTIDEATGKGYLQNIRDSESWKSTIKQVKSIFYTWASFQYVLPFMGNAVAQGGELFASGSRVLFQDVFPWYRDIFFSALELGVKGAPHGGKTFIQAGKFLFNPTISYTDMREVRTWWAFAAYAGKPALGIIGVMLIAYCSYATFVSARYHIINPALNVATSWINAFNENDDISNGEISTGAVRGFRWVGEQITSLGGGIGMALAIGFALYALSVGGGVKGLVGKSK